MKHPYPLVVVTWHDAWQGHDDDTDPNDIEHLPAVYTIVGWLIRDDSVGLSIAMEYGSDGCVRMVNFIPRGMAQRVEVIDAAI